MEAGNPDTVQEQSRPLYCRVEACPADGILGAILGNGGCIFCQGGICSASPVTLSLFATPATQSTPPVASSHQTETRPLRVTP